MSRGEFKYFEKESLVVLDNYKGLVIQMLNNSIHATR